MKRTIEIDDTLQETLGGLTDEVEGMIREYYTENPDEDFSDSWKLWEAMDYSGGLTEQVDSSTPIYYHEIDALHFLHGNVLEEAYDDAGIGDKSEDNWKQIAIYCWLEQGLREWFENNAEDIFNECREEPAKADK